MQILTSLPNTAIKPSQLRAETAKSSNCREASIATSQDRAEISTSEQAQAWADPEQARRISAYVSQSKESGARNLRGIMGLMAGQLTGMTIGSMIFAPLAFKFGNLYIATGGAALTGGALALLGHKLGSRELSPEGENSTLANAGVAAAGLAKSLPSFVYPTVAGATAAEKAIIYEALDRLPLSGVISAPTIDVVTGLEQAGASGLATPLFSHSRIFLDRDQMALGKNWAQEVTVHEIGHTYDFTKGVGPVGNRSHRGGGFGKAPFVSDYAGTNRMEDYAEAYAHYHRHPEELLESAPKKYETIARSQQPGLVDQAMDRPSVRDAGRQVGSAFEKAPYLRNLLALGSSLVSPFQVYRGAANIERGLQTDDAKSMFDGKMQLASGSAFLLPGTAPLGFALTAAHMVAGKMLADGSITAEQADAFASKSLVVATGPVGAVASSVHGELNKAGLLQERGTVSLFGSHKKPFDVGGGKALAGGFAAGAVAGGIVAPLLAGGSAVSTIAAATGGTWLGGLAGAALGVGAHYVAKTLQEKPQPFGLMESASSDKLTWGDRLLLTKFAAPAVAGGVGGAVLGGMAGDYLGTAVGTAVAGAAGGVTGAVLGRYVGILGGSMALAQGGAKLGAAWAKSGTE